MSNHPKIISFHDYGEDIDDPLATIFTASLHKQGLATLSAVIVSTDPVDERGHIGQGILRELNLDNVPIGVGIGRKDEIWFNPEMTPWIPQRLFPTAQSLLKELYAQAEISGEKYTVVVMSPMSDVARLLREEGERFVRYTERVVLMGGVQLQDDNLTLAQTPEGFLIPDQAMNNAFQKAAGNFVYDFLQRSQVPLTIVTRYAAYSATMPVEKIKGYGLLPNPIGSWLINGLEAHFNHFWYCWNLPLGHEIREQRNMLDRMNRDFFINAILKGQGSDRAADEPIYDLLTSVPTYDVLAVAAAVPDLKDKFFQPSIFNIGDVPIEIIGVNPSVSGIKESSALVEKLVNMTTEVLSNKI